MNKFLTHEATTLALGLMAMADLVQVYSEDEENPNASAWLRSGAVDAIHRVEADAFRAGCRQVFARYDEVLYDWIDCDFDNISDIEEMKHRTRALLNDSPE